jgi:hypothetical protein
MKVDIVYDPAYYHPSKTDPLPNQPPRKKEPTSNTADLICGAFTGNISLLFSVWTMGKDPRSRKKRECNRS